MARKHQPSYHEHFLNDLLELLPVGVIIIDDGGGTIHINTAAKRTWGDQEPAQPFWTRVEMKSPLTGERTEPPNLVIMRALKNGDTLSDEELELASPVGTYFVHNSAAPIRDPAGNVIAAVMVSRDITRRINHDRQVRASEAKYRYLFENNPRPMWVYDRQTLAFLAVNDAAIAHYGYIREEFLGMTIVDIHPPELRESLISATRDISRGPGDLGVWKQLKKDGSLIDAQLSTHDIQLDGRHATLVSMMDVTERTRLQESKQLAQQRLDAALRVSPVMLFNQDTQLRYTWVYGSMTRFSTEGMLGRTDAEFFSQEAAERLVTVKTRVLKNGERTRAIVDLLLDNTRVYLDLIVEPLRDPAGNLTGITGVAMDMTERASLIRELSETRQALEEAVSSTRTVLWSWNVETGELIYSRNGAAVFGLPPNSRITTIEAELDSIPPEDAEEIRRQVALAVSEGESLNVQFRYRPRDSGKELWFEAHGHLSCDHTSHARFLRGVLFDITSRRKIEEVIRANEKRFRQIVENSPSPQVMLDEIGIIQCVSCAAAAKLGYSTEELVGKPAFSLVSLDQRTHIQEQVGKFVQTNKDASAGLVRVCKRDHSMLWIEVDVSKIRAGHAVQGYLVRFAELNLGPYFRAVPHLQVHSE